MNTNYNKELTPELKEKLSKIKHIALDMDGTIYMGSNIFPFTIGFYGRYDQGRCRIFILD